MPIKTQNPGIYQTLVTQLDKTAQHNRQGSFRTKERYYEAMKRFCRFLADHYHLQKLANISGKHLTAYVLYMQAQEKSASTIKTDLAAIRFFHDKMERTKYRLPSNDELERRRFGQADRTWSVWEFNLFLVTCMADGHEDYAAIACLTWYAGLHIHECFRIDTAIAAQALRENAIITKGKGGKPIRKYTYTDTREEAARWIALTLATSLEKGAAIVPEDLILKDFLHNWLTTFKVHEVCSRTMELYYYSERHHIVPALGNAPLDSLTPLKVQTFFYQLQAEKHLSQRTISLVRGTRNCDMPVKKVEALKSALHSVPGPLLTRW